MSIGLDLGGVCSKVAFAPQVGSPVLIADARDPGLLLTSTIVAFDSDLALVGRLALYHLERQPAAPSASAWRDRAGSDQTVLVDTRGQSWPSTALTALLLLKLRRDLAVHSDSAAAPAALAVPLSSSEPERRATITAARVAGFEDVVLVEEPLAIAAHYGIDQGNPRGTWLTCDVGGTGCRAAVLQSERSALRPIATAELPEIGGARVDDFIADAIAEQFVASGTVGVLDDPAAATALRTCAERMKRRLSDGQAADIRTTLLLGDRVEEIVLTREAFEQRLAHLLDQTIALCDRTLQSAGLSWSTLKGVLLAGGGVALPGLKDRILAQLGGEPKRLRVEQPQMAVAFGAALLARDAGLREVPPPDASWQSLPCDLGFRTRAPGSAELQVDVVVPRGMPLPVTGTRRYYRQRADQRQMVFELVCSRAAGEWQRLGLLTVKLDDGAVGTQIDVRLDCDPAGGVTFNSEGARSLARTTSRFQLPAPGVDAAISELRALVQSVCLVE